MTNFKLGNPVKFLDYRLHNDSPQIYFVWSAESFKNM